MPANLENSACPQEWKRSVFIPISKKGNDKECSDYCTIALISHASKVMLKIFQARLQQYVNHELPDVQAGFRKGRGTRDQTANIRWIIPKARELRKTSTSALLTTPNPLTVWITINCGKFFKKWEYQTTWPASWETYMQVSPSPTRWTWVSVNSGGWWWTGRPGVLRFMGLQRVGHDWVTEVNWTELKYI